jgi:hypothetical protein
MEDLEGLFGVILARVFCAAVTPRAHHEMQSFRDARVLRMILSNRKIAPNKVNRATKRRVRALGRKEISRGRFAGTSTFAKW